MAYSYYDYLEKYYEDHYDAYYSNYLWPSIYGNSSVYNGTYPPSPYDYVQPYNMDLINPILFGISLLCSLLTILLAVYIYYKIYRDNTSPKAIIVLTSLCIFIHVAINILDPFTYYTWYINFDPTSNIAWHLYVVWDILWTLSKSSIYVLFTCRYYYIYTAAAKLRNNYFIYSKSGKYVIFGIIAIMLCAQFILISIYMKYHYAYINAGYSNKEFEIERTYLNAQWCYTIFEIFICCFLCFLFIFSISKLIVDIDNYSTNGNSDIKNRRISGKTKQIILGLELSQTSFDSFRTNAVDIEANNERKRNKRISVVDTVTQHTQTHTETEINNTQKKPVDHQQKKNEIDNLNFRTKLLKTTTHICLTSLVALLSSFFWQFVWAIGSELNHSGLLWFSYTWSVDIVINILCIYLSMDIADLHYSYLCKCHHCILKCILKLTLK
eukprot:258792_1